ncbi:MAG: hypothetical protein JWN02_202, partial [Acidobacteria bacterium]|nr:hypothetical protein [Acidobacteriota bacterium]
TTEGDGVFTPKSVELYAGTSGVVGGGGPAPSPCPKGNDGLPGGTAANQRLELKKP